MTDPRPLIENEADAFERELLRAASADAPSPGARARTLAALGIGGTIAASAAAANAATAVGEASAALGTSAVAAGSTAASSAAAGGAATTASAGGTLLIAKWVGVGVFAGAVTAGTTAALTAPGASDTTGAAATTASFDPAPRAVVPPRVRPAPPAATATIAPDESVKAKGAKPSGSAPPLPDVAAEVRSLGKARDALERGLPHAALAALAAHEREFSGGVLAPEVELMRIDALVAAGQRERAEAAARAFIARNPKSPHAARVRTLLGAPPAAVAPKAESPEVSSPAPAPPATASFPDP